MNAPLRSLASSVLLLGGVAGGLAGQAATPPLAPVLPEEREIALARSAAPSQVSADADVYVLRRGGHVKAVSGSSGVACIVARDHPESVYPICYNAEGARTVLRSEIRRQQLREQGWTEERIEAEIDRALAAGELNVPQAPAMAWMMSPQQVIYASAAGPRVGQWHPHMMIYMPGASERALGLVETPGADVFLIDAGKATAHLIVKTPTWSDGARDGS